MIRYLRVWRQLVVNALVREAEYRVSFAVYVVAGLAQLTLAVLTFELLYQFTDEVSGWSKAQILVLVGVYRLVEGLVALQVAPNVSQIGEYVREGELDFFLLRPVSSQFLVSTRRLVLPEAVNALIGLSLALYAAGQAGARLGPLELGAALVFLLCGVVLLYVVWFAISTCAFWLVTVDTFGYLYEALFEAARYPLGFFQGAARVFFTFVFPVAFATTFPTQALLGATDLRLLALAVALAAAALAASHVFWTFALRHYASASS